jgi:hypothetical protein
LGNYLLADYEPHQNDDIATKVYFAHFPSGSSVKQASHFAQQAASKRFQRYDYGPLENLVVYGQKEPPAIDLRKVRDVPIALIAGSKDHLSTGEDTRWALYELSQQVVLYKEFNLGHLSYFLSKDMSYFRDDVMGVLSKYHPAK